MASISTATAMLIAAGVTMASAAGTAYVSNDNAIDARSQGRKTQREQLEAAEAAANKSQAATTTNVGTVALQSEEDLGDEAIRSKSKKNRLRVDKTGLGVGSSSSGSSTGLKL